MLELGEILVSPYYLSVLSEVQAHTSKQACRIALTYKWGYIANLNSDI